VREGEIGREAGREAGRRKGGGFKYFEVIDWF